MATTTRGKLFYAYASKGHHIKVVFDTWAQGLNRARFRIDKTGFYNRDVDDNEHMLYDLSLLRNKFRVFVCRRKMVFSVNMKHIRTLVKNVKKKDSVILYISKKRPDRLFIAIKPEGGVIRRTARLETSETTIVQEELDTEMTALPETYTEDGVEYPVYSNPVIMESTDFQKIKKLCSIGKIATIQMQNDNFIRFISDKGSIYGTTFQVGELVTGEESDYDSDGDGDGESIDLDEGSESESDDSEGEIEPEGWYEGEFYTSLITLLMKLPGLSQQMQFYAPGLDGMPLKIQMDVGNLGHLSIFIKDIHQIAFEDGSQYQAKPSDSKRV